jgi:Icc-related predicted phosphoesterase
MRIQLISDVHLEFQKKPLSYLEPLLRHYHNQDDILVIAGDFLYLSKVPHQVLRYLSDNYRMIFYVPGNHEYYKLETSKAPEVLKSLEETYPKLKVLAAEKDPVEVDGIKFWGDTMWFEESPQNVLYQGFINDFYHIKQFQPWVYDRNRVFRERASYIIDKNTIVVTHHLPSYCCVDPIYKDSVLNRFFVCNMDWIISNEQPKYWLHGHTHEKVDVKLGETRVIANPFGYPDEYQIKKPLILDL